MALSAAQAAANKARLDALEVRRASILRVDSGHADDLRAVERELRLLRRMTSLDLLLSRIALPSSSRPDAQRLGERMLTIVHTCYELDVAMDGRTAKYSSTFNSDVPWAVADFARFWPRTLQADKRGAPADKENFELYWGALQEQIKKDYPALAPFFQVQLQTLSASVLSMDDALAMVAPRVEHNANIMLSGLPATVRSVSWERRRPVGDFGKGTRGNTATFQSKLQHLIAQVAGYPFDVDFDTVFAVSEGL